MITVTEEANRNITKVWRYLITVAHLHSDPGFLAPRRHLDLLSFLGEFINGRSRFILGKDCVPTSSSLKIKSHVSLCCATYLFLSFLEDSSRLHHLLLFPLFLLSKKVTLCCIYNQLTSSQEGTSSTIPSSIPSFLCQTKSCLQGWVAL